MSSIASDFGLTAKQTALLLSTEYAITRQDISLAAKKGGSGMIFKTNDIALREKWLNTWLSSTNQYLKSLPGDVINPL